MELVEKLLLNNTRFNGCVFLKKSPRNAIFVANDIACDILCMILRHIIPRLTEFFKNKYHCENDQIIAKQKIQPTNKLLYLHKNYR